jgi:hypothetical protein
MFIPHWTGLMLYTIRFGHNYYDFIRARFQNRNPEGNATYQLEPNERINNC